MTMFDEFAGKKLEKIEMFGDSVFVEEICITFEGEHTIRIGENAGKLWMSMAIPRYSFEDASVASQEGRETEEGS